MSSNEPIPAKDAIRQRMLEVRAALPAFARESASRAAAARLASLPGWRRARTVALYFPLGAEADTAELARRALNDGKRLAWPRIAADGAPGLEFAACAPGELVPGPARALEPPASAPALPPGAVDLVVVPGVAFDAGGRRLGRGRGHYDVTLTRLPPAASRVGLAFDEQVLDRVPVEPHDVRLDAVVTPTRVLVAPGRPGTVPVDTVPDA